MRIIAVLVLCSSLGPAAVRAGRESLTDERAPAESIGAVTETTPAVDPRALAVSAEITAGLAAEPEKWLDRLAQSLTGGLESDSQMVRAIHDWVTLNVSYDTVSLLSESVSDGRVADVLRARRSACRGYANLFGELCRRSGLDCVTIQGHARGVGFHPFGPEAPAEPNHAWNAVRVGGRWRLVDATWDAGRYRTDAGYEQRYSTDYLFPDPACQCVSSGK